MKNVSEIDLEAPEAVRQKDIIAEMPVRIPMYESIFAPANIIYINERTINNPVFTMETVHY